LTVIAITDHDHIETVRDWLAASGVDRDRVLPGVELTARGRIVHLGVLFSREVPEVIPAAGTPLLDLVRWARGIPGSIVVLVHPLPLLWRFQLRHLARSAALPDAIETRFPLVGWRTSRLERAAREYGLAVVGGTDAHLTPGQLGQHVTVFPGRSIDDLVSAIRERATIAATRGGTARPPAAAFAIQTAYSWLLPFRRVPRVAALRASLLSRARNRVAAGPLGRDRGLTLAEDR
jgi:predicted metal-dependent phosphoesterase TrpH